MERSDMHYQADGQQFDLSVLIKKDTLIKQVYAVYKNGVWMANICKAGRAGYKALSYARAFTLNDLEIISRLLDHDKQRLPL